MPGMPPLSGAHEVIRCRSSIEPSSATAMLEMLWPGGGGGEEAGSSPCPALLTKSADRPASKLRWVEYWSHVEFCTVERTRSACGLLTSMHTTLAVATEATNARWRRKS